MSRYRERGLEYSRSLKVPSMVYYQTRNVYIGGKWVREYREVPKVVAGQVVTESNKETMTDEVGKRALFNPVDHVHRSTLTFAHQGLDWKTNPPNVTSWATYGERRNTAGDCLTGRVFLSSGDILSSLPTFPAVDWNSLVGSVGESLSGRMQTSSNILVEIAQLSQTIGMLKNPFNVKAARRFRKSALTLSQLAKTSANAWLEYRYGWRNLYLSMKSFSSVIGEVRRHRQYLEETQNKFVSCAASSTATTSWTGTLGSSRGVYTQYYDVTAYKAGASRKCVFSVDVMRPKHVLAMSNFDMAMQRTGANNVLEALWDLVPFSFVVDWFVNIGDWVTRDPIFWNTHTLRRVGYSVKSEYFAYLKGRMKITTYYGSSPTVYSTGDPEVIAERYQRVAGFPPDTSEVGFFGSLNKTQLADAAALIVQRI